jgi:hypothetical protein
MFFVLLQAYLQVAFSGSRVILPQLNIVFSSFICYLLDHEFKALPWQHSEPSFLDDKFLSYEIKSGDVPVSVNGRLRKSLQFWKDIDAPHFIINTI